jgi:hypothetical protein
VNEKMQVCCQSKQCRIVEAGSHAIQPLCVKLVFFSGKVKMYNTHSKTRPSERLMFQTALFFSANTANPSQSNRVRGCATHPTAGRGFLFDFAQDCAASRLILLRRRNISRRF